jgi:hypothetical protein
MNTQNKSITLLFNPFFYIAGIKALGLGWAAILLAGLIGSWGHVHFDGVLDTHVGATAALWFFWAEGIMDWLCLSVVLWVCGKIISQSAFRAVDLFGTQALARWPTLFISLITLPQAFRGFANELIEQLKQGKFQFNTADAIIFFCIVIAMIPFTCWMVALMYKSFSVSCNVKGGKAIGTFVAGLVVAEILSKLCLVLVLHHMPAHVMMPARPVSTPVTAAGVQVAPPESSTETAGDITGAGARFVDLLVKEDFAGAFAQFDTTMKSAMPEQRLREVWRTLQQQAGSFQKQIGTRVEEAQGYKVVFVTCQFKQAVLDMKVVFDSKKQVAGLFYVSSQKG